MSQSRASSPAALAAVAACWAALGLPRAGATNASLPSALCAANKGCAGLPGSCCPALGGMMLSCCQRGAEPSTSAANWGDYVNHYDGSNPLRIEAHATRSNNYFLILGDWGKADSPGSCQRAVAEHMKSYIRKQSAAGRKLLFVAAVGDNFYWSGVKPESWRTSWSEPYGANDPGSPLYQVPWLAVLGNHDFGNDDPYAFCPYAQAQALASFGGQLYGGSQLNADKNPSRPVDTAHYWLPDYNYHYEIPEADLEVIAVDTNSNGLGDLGGDDSGHAQAFGTCGGVGEVEAFLTSVTRSGTELLRQRARQGTARTVLIIQHYPGACQRDVFEAALPAGRQVKVICAYGHVHDQKCEGRDGSGNCDTILAGGGGGCCGPVIQNAGFAAVQLTDDGGFRADVESPEVSMPGGSCVWRRRLQHV